MTLFTPGELEFLAGQQLGRIATVDGRGRPHVVPVAFRINEELQTIDVGGHAFSSSKKFRDVAATGYAAIVFDDVLPPWRPRGIEVRGPATTVAEGGSDIHAEFDAAIVRIVPQRIVGWGIDTDAFDRNARSVTSG